MDYINKTDAINAAIDAADDWDGGYVRSRAEMIEKKIKALPSADVEEVIRCKDCKYFNLNKWGKVNDIPLIVAHEICDFWGEGCKTDKDAYCSFAERRDKVKDYFRGETADRLFKELVEERKTAKWEIIDEVEPRRYGCSNCKRMVWHIENFCPNCGARMTE